MKNLLQCVMELNLTPAERNNFSQTLKGSTWDKHFNKLSKENLLILKKIFERKIKQCSLYDSVQHCKYALNRIDEALNG
jgi:hypothetical protein